MSAFPNVLKVVTQSNSSIITSVTIHVTPDKDYYVSWTILGIGFVLATGFAAVQVWRDEKWAKQRRAEARLSGSDGEVLSAGDLTRSMFHRSLLLALLTRLSLLPVQVISYKIWWEFLADTLPEMTFASAWTLLVTFFVQLVAVATGTGSNMRPSFVIQVTAYIIYGVLVLACLWNNLAPILVYALLCCIYAALLGTAVAFGPRLYGILRPHLDQRSEVAVRLVTCGILCIIVFSCRTLGFARKVVAPPKSVSLWLNYGTMELVPSIIILLTMFPTRSNNSGEEGSEGGRNTRHHVHQDGRTFVSISSAVTGGGSAKPGYHRSNSAGSANSASRKWGGENTALLKEGTGYGATRNSDAGS